MATPQSSARPTHKQLRRFGLLVGAVLILIGGWQWYRDIYETGRVVLWAAGGVILASGLFVPAVLWPLYRGWMRVGHTLGLINTRLIIGLIFFLVVTPIGLLMRVLRVDPLRKKFDRKAASYWHEIAPKESVKEHCERQF